MTLHRLALAAGAAATLCLTTLPALAFGPERFDAKALQVDNLLGSLEIRVEDGAADITVSADGKDKELLDRLKVGQRGRTVVIDMDIPERNNRSLDIGDDAPKVIVTLPAGTPLEIEDMIGSLEAQSGLGEVRINLESAASMEFGDVGSMTVDAKGALNLEVGKVQDGLTVAMHGAGNIQAGRVTGRADLAVKGVGNVDVEWVEGPVGISLNGIGRIDVADGRAKTLDIDVSGMGAVSYGGEAETKRINKSGFASVSYRGQSM